MFLYLVKKRNCGNNVCGFRGALTITQNSIRTTSELDRSHLTDIRSTENDQIGADTDPEYRIDASLVIRV